MSLALANSAINAAPPNRKPCLQETVHALEHYTASLVIVRERIGRALNVGHNEIIATVVGVAAYDVRSPLEIVPTRDKGQPADRIQTI